MTSRECGTRELRRVKDGLVRSLTINFGLMLLASTTLLLGAITYATGILVALESR